MVRLGRGPQMASITTTVTDSGMYDLAVDAAYRRRNRLGGFPYTANHALEGYVTLEQLQQNPAWAALRGYRRF